MKKTVYALLLSLCLLSSGCGTKEKEHVLRVEMTDDKKLLEDIFNHSIVTIDEEGKEQGLFLRNLGTNADLLEDKQETFIIREDQKLYLCTDVDNDGVIDFMHGSIDGLVLTEYVDALFAGDFQYIDLGPYLYLVKFDDGNYGFTMWIPSEEVSTTLYEKYAEYNQTENMVKISEEQAKEVLTDFLCCYFIDIADEKEKNTAKELGLHP